VVLELAAATYEVRLRNEKIPRNVVSAPSVGAGTTYEVCLGNKINLVMWSQHRQSVLVPLTRFTYEKNKKSRDVVSAPSVGAGTTYEVCLRQKINLVMWSQHRQSVLVPLTRFTYETKKYLVMWFQHRQSVLVPLTRSA
jgi:microcompartment protein CcmK/EutM